MSMEINEMQEMNERAKKALEYHKKGYNCSQAVACSFCEEFGVDEETMFRIAEGFWFRYGHDGHMRCGYWYVYGDGTG